MLYADDVIVRMLGGLGLKTPARRLLDRAPGWVVRLDTREIRHRPRLVDEHALQARYAEALGLLAKRGVPVGDYLEFGVYNGTSMTCMYRALSETGNRRSRLIGFDSFEGLPLIADTDSGGHWRPGEFKSSLEFARRVLEYEGVDLGRVTLVKGYFETTLTEERRAELDIRTAGIVMIDCDLYQSTLEALRFCAPAITDQSIVFFDDWFPLADRDLGEKAAFDEWLAGEPELSAEELFDFLPYGKAFSVTRR